MNFDDQDWEAGPPSTGVARGVSTAWKVAAGVAFGMVVGGALVYLVERQRAPSAEAAAPPIERMIQDKPPAAGGAKPSPPAAKPQAPPPPPPLADRALRAPEPVSLSASETAAAAESMNGDPDAEAVLRAAHRAAERKDRAWAEFYKKPAMCDEYTSRDVMVECANQYIRARGQFEETYSAGKR